MSALTRCCRHCFTLSRALIKAANDAVTSFGRDNEEADEEDKYDDDDDELDEEEEEDEKAMLSFSRRGDKEERKVDKAP